MRELETKYKDILAQTSSPTEMIGKDDLLKEKVTNFLCDVEGWKLMMPKWSHFPASFRSHMESQIKQEKDKTPKKGEKKQTVEPYPQFSIQEDIKRMAEKSAFVLHAQNKNLFPFSLVAKSEQDAMNQTIKKVQQSFLQERKKSKNPNKSRPKVSLCLDQNARSCGFQIESGLVQNTPSSIPLPLFVPLFPSFQNEKVEEIKKGNRKSLLSPFLKSLTLPQTRGHLFASEKDKVRVLQDSVILKSDATESLKKYQDLYLVNLEKRRK